eukprot:CAMPEP_0194128382 /NCGR_PEP_ID=MMETSP0150-20130528/61023_1 /TAXON_ID=122233 /ORGANISM="Chaetoceros debilis, Strain MM31A-1" /LENGTH=587 /DNA_ID=CAMNT_0038822367 /DNA_START=203 /DNA_END=1966 /DNA_ORIENTATION=-
MKKSAIPIFGFIAISSIAIAAVSANSNSNLNSIPRSTGSRSIDPNRHRRSEKERQRNVSIRSSKGKKSSNSRSRSRNSSRNTKIDLDHDQQHDQQHEHEHGNPLPPWNPSPKINPNGFLADLFQREHGEWETDAGVTRQEYGRYMDNGNDNGNIDDMNTNMDGMDDLHEPVYVRQVPGDGNCLFHSITVALALVENRTHVDMSFDNDNYGDGNGDGNGNNGDGNGDGYIDCRLNPYPHDLHHLHHHSRHLRSQAVHMLSHHPRKLLFLQGNEYLRAKDLVTAAAAQYNLSAEEYCNQMKKDSVWGGGPEIVGLCNYLKRPIHVYELSSSSSSSSISNCEEEVDKDHTQSSESDENSSSSSSPIRSRSQSQFRLRRMACFGSPKFDRKEPLHILSADSRFPDLEPGQQLSSGNHFLAIFPKGVIAEVKREQEEYREMQMNMVEERGQERLRFRLRKKRIVRKTLRGGDASDRNTNTDTNTNTKTNTAFVSTFSNKQKRNKRLSSSSSMPTSTSSEDVYYNQQQRHTSRDGHKNRQSQPEMGKSKRANESSGQDQRGVANMWSGSNENGVLQYVRKLLDQVKIFVLWWV